MDYRTGFSITTIFKVATTYKYTKPHIPHLSYVALFFSPIAHITFIGLIYLLCAWFIVYLSPPAWKFHEEGI